MKKKNMIILLILLVINQICILSRNIEIGFTTPLMVTFVFGIICDIVLIWIMFKQGEKTRIAKEMEEIRLQAEREHAYYEEMENERMQMAKIRHDYNNLISSVLGLIHMEREKEAEELLEEMLSRMDEVGGSVDAESNH